MTCLVRPLASVATAVGVEGTSASAAEQIWHLSGSQAQILAGAFREKSLFVFALFPTNWFTNLEATQGHISSQSSAEATSWR